MNLPLPRCVFEDSLCPWFKPWHFFPVHPLSGNSCATSIVEMGIDRWSGSLQDLWSVSFLETLSLEVEKKWFWLDNPVLRCTSKGATCPAKNRDGFPQAALDRLIFVLVTSLIHISVVDLGHFQDRRSIEFYSSYIRYFVHTLPGIARSSKLS